MTQMFLFIDVQRKFISVCLNRPLAVSHKRTIYLRTSKEEKPSVGVLLHYGKNGFLRVASIRGHNYSFIFIIFWISLLNNFLDFLHEAKIT